MAGLAREIVTGVSLHVTQRENRRQPAFFCDEDYGAWAGRDDALIRVRPTLLRVSEWETFLRTPDDDANVDQIHRHDRTVHPLWSENVVKRLEYLSGRRLRPQKPGPKPKRKKP